MLFIYAICACAYVSVLMFNWFLIHINSIDRLQFFLCIQIDSFVYKLHFSFFLSICFRIIENLKMSSPKLEDLPKVAVDLKTQLEGFSTDKLKDTVTQEKIVLPTAEGMFQEKKNTKQNKRNE